MPRSPRSLTGSFSIVAFSPALLGAAAALANAATYPTLSDESAGCNECHKQQTPAIVAQWGDSNHFRANVGCYECHGAKAGAPGAWEHNGSIIHTIVTPADCATCHEHEAQQFQASRHAKAAEILGSLDNVLAEVVEGNKAFFGGSALLASGCQQCHGATVKVDAHGRPTPATWPNTGMGRINLDGSRGSCSACHQRHTFSAAQARVPDTCGKCHLGPDHPQAEIYEESKHGIAYRTRKADMNLLADTWVVGLNYTAAPACATCHMSATPAEPLTHDVGARISWTLRPVISKKLPDWEKKRSAMKAVCTNCHGGAFVDSFYKSYDDTVDLWNTKFAQPAQDIMNALRQAGKLTPTPFDEEIEWTFYRLWHHEGRRARMGAAMQGPDFVQWHGFFEVAENFYTKFLPEAREAAHGNEKVLALIKAVEEDPRHVWKKGLSPEERQKIDRFYKERYGN